MEMDYQEIGDVDEGTLMLYWYNDRVGVILYDTFKKEIHTQENFK